MLSIGGLASGNNLDGFLQNGEFRVQAFGPIVVPKSPCLVFIIGFVALNGGAGTTGYTIRLRRGLTTADTQVQSTGVVGASASVVASIPIAVIDTLVDQGTVSYTLTATGAGMAGSGGACLGALAAFFMQ